MKSPGIKIYVANPRGFCAGVDRAIEIVNRAIDLFGAPIYVKHEVVHNKFVVDGLRQKGAIFIEDLSEVPPGSTLIFSAHGVSQAVKDEARLRGFKLFDATCPLVTKVHNEVSRKSREHQEGILIGHKGHPEVEGTMGQYQTRDPSRQIHLIEKSEDIDPLSVNDPDHLFYVSQTTLSVDETRDIIADLKVKFPKIQGPRKDDICYATQNRQDAVKRLSEQCELILVVGSQTSSNSNRLKELAEKCGAKSFLIDNAEEIQADWLQSVNHIGVTAGASAPEILVEQVIEKLVGFGGSLVDSAMENPENMFFPLPLELR